MIDIESLTDTEKVEHLDKIEKEILEVLTKEDLSVQYSFYVLESIISTMCLSLVYKLNKRDLAISVLKTYVEHFQQEISTYESQENDHVNHE